MESEEKRDKLERVQKALYSRNSPNILGKERSEFGESKEDEDEMEVKKNWGDVENNSFDKLASKFSMATSKKGSFINKIFVFSIVFFVLASAVAGFVLFGGVNMISSKNVDIEITGPISIGAGQEADFEIKILNRNNTELNKISLFVEYPEGTRYSDDLTKDLDKEKFSLDKIISGGVLNQNIKAVFFGSKGDIKQIKISLEYKVPNSNAVFYKEKIHEISIDSVPVIVTPTYPKEVNSNQDMVLDVELSSNSKENTNNFLVNIEYPSGFVFESATPSASFGNNNWNFSNLESGEKKKISIKGKIIGQDGEEKIFRINTGTANQDDDRVIAVPLSQSVESIMVKRSFIGLDVYLNGERQDDIYVQGGSKVSVMFDIKNNLPSKIFNVSAEVDLSGSALNQSGISTLNGGFFQSFNNKIIWDKRSAYGLDSLSQGEGVKLNFTVSPLDYSNISKNQKAEIVLNIKVSGERITNSGSSEIVYTTETRKIILATDVSVKSRVVRSLGNIENTGPVPPKANIPTTYTIHWSISNSFNQVSNVLVKAQLPSYVKWTNVSNPSNEIINYNKDTNEVVWNVDSILANTGFGSTKKEVYFQIEILPSINQIGQEPVILGKTYLTGIDKITGNKVSDEDLEVTTNFYGDPSFKSDYARVVK